MQACSLFGSHPGGAAAWGGDGHEPDSPTTLHNLGSVPTLKILTLLHRDGTIHARTAIRIKQEKEAAGTSSSRSHVPQEEVLENLRTIEAIQYLSAEYQPTQSQSEKGITQLTRKLSAYNLTKAEKLQIVNLAPTEPVELYVIVEELEDRFATQIDEILDAVKASLSTPAPTASASAAAPTRDINRHEIERVYREDEMAWDDYESNEVVFDDAGEGAGIEGDLEADDD
ncbi:hypothetical protein NM688_g8579 [Phlebia brevispora]|uniref:Uncharacterized protein n=1 Tax=Phlebia brevispora TaxID=194682 RepID=A0ACC1RQM8_9APHY|nr:hypothetical protein NM688_g8579 [Phlebia brevispora]